MRPASRTSASAIADDASQTRRDQSIASRLSTRYGIDRMIWAGIIILGRLIAYDHIWGHLSPATKA